MFHSADAAVFRGILLKFRPKRLVEIGSGFSTALALDVAEEALPALQITCVDPYADRLRSRLIEGDDKRVRLLESVVQDIDPQELVSDPYRRVVVGHVL
jgi:hypothetical protein